MVLQAALALLLGAPGADARPLPVSFQSHYQAEIIGPEEGFPQNSCSGITPAPDGSLWMGTFRGLVRFNGHEYRHWGPPEAPHLQHTGIISLHRDARGRTWFSTLTGLDLHDGGRWRSFRDDPGWGDARDFVRSFADHPEKPFVVGRFSGGVTSFDGTRFKALPPPEGFGGTFCAYDGGGTLYAVRAGQLQVFEDASWRPLSIGADSGSTPLGLAQDGAGHMVVVCADELVRVRDRRVVSRLPLRQPVRQFWKPAFDAAGHLWLASLDSGAYRIAPDGEVLRLQAADGLPSAGGVRAVYPAPDGVIWIGAGVGGVTRLRPVRFRYLGRPDSIGEREILSLAPLPDGSVLMAPTATELQRFDPSGAVAPAIPLLGQPGSGHVRSVLAGRDGTVWCGTVLGGLARWTSGRLEHVPVPSLPEQETVHSLFEDSRGRLWIGGERVIVRKSGADARVIPVTGPRGYTFFAERSDGSIVLARHHEVYVCRDDRPPALAASLAPGTRISSVLVDAADRVWLGTTGEGLAVLHEGRVHVPRLRVAAGNIQGLILDAQGHLWFGSERRIVRVRPEDLWELVVRPQATPRIQVFDTDDGLRNLELPFGTQPAAARDARGRLWFALIRGAVRIDPALLTPRQDPPRVILESISYLLDGPGEADTVTLGAPEGRVTLPPGSHSIRVEFAGLDFSAPGKQRFLVLLDGVAQTREPQAAPSFTFARLAPGSHTLQIQAIGSDGAWNTEGARLALSLAPYFWQTRWFQALVGASLLGLCGGGAWYVGHRRVVRVRLQLAREQRLAAAQARLALVLENTVDFVLFADAAGRLVFLNRAGRALVGLAADAGVERTAAAALLAPDARDRFTAEALPAAARAGTWTGELALQHRDGRAIPVSAVIVAHPRPDGTLDFAALIARDISATRRQAAVQEALRGLATALTDSLAPEPLGRAIAGACREVFRHDAFFLVLVLEGNATAIYMEDTPEGAAAPVPFPPVARHLESALNPVLAGTSLLFQRDPGSPPPNAVAFGAWGTDRRSRSMMFVPIVRDQRTIGIISVQSYTPHRYDDGDLEQLGALAAQCGAAIARMHVEGQLRENEERLRLAMQAARMGSWEIDLGTQSLRASPEAEAIYGRALGRDPFALAAGLAEAHAAEFRPQLSEILAGRASTLSHTHLVQVSEHESRWFEVSGHVRRAGGSVGPARVIGVTTDITSRRRAELERGRLEEQLRQSQKLEAIGTLAGGIAHDFNNILTAILGNLELAQIDLPAELPAQRRLERIRESGHRASELVRRLLAFSRPHPTQRRPIALEPVVREVIALLRATIPATADLRTTFAPGVPAIEADPTEVHQVILNLGTNAWHALGGRPGWIAFTVDSRVLSAGETLPHPDLRPGGYARVRVQDNGHGIPPEILPRVFDPFFTTKGPGEGTGLGLSVAHGIMRACHGAIVVDSTPGTGTTFDLYFPASAAAPTPPPTAAPSAPSPAVACPGRILVVDDEQALLEVVQPTLARHAYQVVTYADPVEALARFQADPRAFDLVLSDLAMPGMTGVELAAKLLALRPDLPIVIASGHIRPEVIVEARQLGVRAVIEKIDAYSRLPALIAQHLAR